MSFMGTGAFGFDETMGGPMDMGFGDRPAMPAFRSTRDMNTLAPALVGAKADQLASAPRMPAAPKSMLKKVPFLGAAYTGYQTAATNPARLNGPGRVLHGMGTGAVSAVTPPMLGLMDAATGNYAGNAVEDSLGAMLKPWFGAPKEHE